MKGPPKGKFQSKPKTKGLLCQKKKESRSNQDSDSDDKQINSQPVGFTMYQNDQEDKVFQNLDQRRQEYHPENSSRASILSSLLEKLQTIILINLKDPSFYSTIQEMIDQESSSVYTGIKQQFEKGFKEVKYDNIIDDTQTDESPFYYVKSTKKNSPISHQVKKNLTRTIDIIRYFHTVIQLLEHRSDIFQHAFRLLLKMIRNQYQSQAKKPICGRRSLPRKKSAQQQLQQNNHSLSPRVTTKRQPAQPYFLETNKETNINSQIAVLQKQVKDIQLQNMKSQQKFTQIKDEGYFFPKTANNLWYGAKYLDEVLTLGNNEFEIANTSNNRFRIHTKIKSGNYFFIPNPQALLGHQWSNNEFVAFSAMEVYQICH